MGANDSANHRKARAFINAKVKARSLAHPNTLPCVVCKHVWVKGERRHEYDHTHDYDDPKTWSIVEVVCTTCHHDRTKKREGVQATVELNEAERAGGVTGKGFMPGMSGNPGGISKERREFLSRLKGEDAEKIWLSYLKLVDLGNPPAVLFGMAHLVGKAPEKVEVSGNLKADVQHEVKAEVIQSADWQRQVLALAIKTGVINTDGQLVETTENPE